MEITHLRPGDLQPNPWNTNEVSPEGMERLCASLERNGWVRPIVAREIEGSYQILGGQHRVEAARYLGYDTVPVVVLHDISDNRAKEIGLIDNARYGEDDAVGLAELIADLGGAQELGTFLPIGDEELFTLSTEIDDENIDDLIDGVDDERERVEEKPKTVKTHRVMRFKVAIEDGDAITDMLETVMREQGLTDSDALTNAGDALVFVMGEWAASKLSEDA